MDYHDVMLIITECCDYCYENYLEVQCTVYIELGTLSTPSIHVHSYGEHQKPFFSSLLLYTLATERTYVLSGWLLYVLDVLTDFIYTIGRYYVKWVKTSWTYSIMVGVNGNNHGF